MSSSDSSDSSFFSSFFSSAAEDEKWICISVNDNVQHTNTLSIFFLFHNILYNEISLTRIVIKNLVALRSKNVTVLTYKVKTKYLRVNAD